MNTLPLPPVPQKVRNILKEYPEKIQKLQDILSGYFKNPNPVMPFDGAVWILEDALASFISEARYELKVAESSGDPEVIRRAEEKEKVMHYARSGNRGMSDLNELLEYIEAHKEMLS
ncbi:hypothetical protein [Xanthomonas medicagonis]|uniref:hypothetical protein n=1 Tax=Xanthomonas medicagonis TaxID=3160841 RepID=UPI00351270DE